MVRARIETVNGTGTGTGTATGTGTGTGLDSLKGWIVDFADLTRAWQPMHDALDHRVLNDVPGLENPTSELLARCIAERFVAPAPAVLHAVTVHETCTSESTVWLG